MAGSPKIKREPTRYFKLEGPVVLRIPSGLFPFLGTIRTGLEWEGCGFNPYLRILAGGAIKSATFKKGGFFFRFAPGWRVEEPTVEPRKDLTLIARLKLAKEIREFLDKYPGPTLSQEDRFPGWRRAIETGKRHLAGKEDAYIWRRLGVGYDEMANLTQEIKDHTEDRLLREGWAKPIAEISLT
jgi:hypothetical protein